MEGLHTCANCHSFSADGKTLTVNGVNTVNNQNMNTALVLEKQPDSAGEPLRKPRADGAGYMTSGLLAAQLSDAAVAAGKRCLEISRRWASVCSTADLSGVLTIGTRTGSPPFAFVARRCGLGRFEILKILFILSIPVSSSDAIDHSRQRKLWQRALHRVGRDQRASRSWAFSKRDRASND